MSRLQQILDIVNATEESAFDDLTEMLKPGDLDRESAGEVYESCLGYDPTSYFDRREIKDKVQALTTSDMPEGVASIVEDESERISDMAYDIYDERRSEFMDEAIDAAVSDITGWDRSTDDDDIEDVLDDLSDEEDED